MSLDPAAYLHKEQQTSTHQPLQGIQFQQNGHQQAQTFGFEQVLHKLIKNILKI